MSVNLLCTVRVWEEEEEEEEESERSSDQFSSDFPAAVDSLWQQRMKHEMEREEKSFLRGLNYSAVDIAIGPVLRCEQTKRRPVDDVGCLFIAKGTRA